MIKQRAVVVGYVNQGGTEKHLHVTELNKLLDDGWIVAAVHQLSPVAGSGGGNSSLVALGCLVVVEKDDAP